MSRRSPASSERGAALLVVLLLVSVMSLVAVASSDAVRFAARRGANVAERDQAVWHLHGAEELARAMLRRSARLDPERTTLDQPWAAGPQRFEVEGGSIQGVLTDASNCFNLNSLARPRERGTGYAVDDTALAQLMSLLAALDIDGGSARRLAFGAADWIDSDGSARSGGAEDYDYAFADPPYRTADGLFAEVDELRAIDGVSEGTFRRVRSYLCARTDVAPARLNLNTLTADQAPLLTMLFDGRLSVDDARNVIQDRPDDGWTEPEQFWDLEAVSRHAVTKETKAQVGLRATHFELRAQVRSGAAFVEARTLFRQGAGDAVTLVRRRMGES